MFTKCLRHPTCLPLYISRQPAIRLANIIHHALRAPYLRHLSSTPYHLKAAIVSRSRSGPSKDSLSRKIFSESDVPDLSFWETYACPPLVPADTVTAEACHDACRDYVALALQNLPNWQRRCPSLFTLQYVVVVLMNSPGSVALAMHILHTCVALDYAPAILSLVYLGFRTGKLDDIHLTKAKEGLERLSSLTHPRGGSSRPDALTLTGLIAASLGTPNDDTRALKFFSEAASAFASSPDAQWQWRASAVLAQGRILEKRSRPDLARALYEAHVRETDNPDVLYAYAMHLDRSDPTRVLMLERAAISACPAAALEMARVEVDRARDAGLSKRDRHDRLVLADEWLKIAGEEEVA